MPVPEVVDILLVEDNPDDVELTLRALRRCNVVNPIHVVRDGVEALDFLFRRGPFASLVGPQPRLILLDLKLPRVSGLEVLSAAKECPSTRAIPVVVLTSSREVPDIEEAYRLGANSYIVKPVSFDGFVETMAQLGFYWLMLNTPPE